jgi:hypothetical protein
MQAKTSKKCNGGFALSLMESIRNAEREKGKRIKGNYSPTHRKL